MDHTSNQIKERKGRYIYEFVQGIIAECELFVKMCSALRATFCALLPRWALSLSSNRLGSNWVNTVQKSAKENGNNIGSSYFTVIRNDFKLCHKVAYTSN